ncbi:MAG TPA: tRNA lysidine(34) synthetase TilS, partial [Armatimonadota bacterium]|nr:tRNA lysidine(34) synthetase TilS [Armatimonadota bacterium]
ISVEEAGRLARYELLREAARKHGCGKIATAHTADDQAETVLLNVFRGCGIDGLAGIPPRRPLQAGESGPEVVRPLLCTRRAEVEAYCRYHGLRPREDRTNRDLRYRRSRIRYRLLPALTEYDPLIREHLARLAAQAREEAELLNPPAAELLARATLPEETPGPELARWLRGWSPPLRLCAAVLRDAPPALARRALRLAVRRTAGHEVELDARATARLLALTEAEGAWDLPGAALRARRWGDALLLEATREAEPLLPRAVPEQGSVAVPELGIRVTSTIAAPPAELKLPPDKAALARENIRGALTLRAPREGERMWPLGAPGSRLLSDLFTDRKVPAPLRPRWPLLTDEEGPLWVAGIAIAERARVTPSTRECLRLRVEPLATSEAPG